MIYTRTFVIQAAHFNDAAYNLRARALGHAEDADKLLSHNVANLELKQAIVLWQMVAEESHGHNFKIVVTVSGEPVSKRENWIIDDVRLAKMVLEWDNKNLSMLPEFAERDLRATTENMAHVLAQRIKRLLRVDDNEGTDPPQIEVQVHETDLICATAIA